MLLSTTSGFFSVIGLAQTFSGIFWFMIAMGIAIEYGKLIGLSFVYRFWSTSPKWLNASILSVIALVIALTASGHYGFIISGYQTTAVDVKQNIEKISLLEQERTRVYDRKQQIDLQISQLPTNSIRGRERLIKQFKDEQTNTTSRLNELDNQLLALKQAQLEKEVHVGPIVFIAKALDVDTDKAAHYWASALVLVFDPFAVLLTLAANVAIRERERKKSLPREEPPTPEPTDDDEYSEDWDDSDLIDPNEFLNEERAEVEEAPVELELEPLPEPIKEVVPEPEVVSEEPNKIQPVTRKKRFYSGLTPVESITTEDWTLIADRFTELNHLARTRDLTIDEKTEFISLNNLLESYATLSGRR